jgi:large subunit ribosomal protein L2
LEKPEEKMDGRKTNSSGPAMNPCDHPYGGGEGRQPRGIRKPKTAWGKITGGHKTRIRKNGRCIIVKRRNKKNKNKS